MTKRLFLGFEVDAPWPASYPAGRLIEPAMRHMTIAYLGSRQIDTSAAPLPPFRVGPVGFFDKVASIKSVLAWHVRWQSDGIEHYIEEVRRWLEMDKGDFLPHVTVCRGEFSASEWKRAFSPLPMVVGALHLYESLGYSQYRAVWSHTFAPPFEEIDHTADVAYRVRAESIEELERNAQIALAFEFPPLLPYLKEAKGGSVGDMVGRLGELVRRVDSEIGAPFKAVSFHGDIRENEGLLEWEMIIDV